MSRKNVALLNFRNLPDAKVLRFSYAIETSLTHNTDFPDTATLVIQLGEEIDTYAEALAISKDGSRLQLAKKIQPKKY